MFGFKFNIGLIVGSFAHGSLFQNDVFDLELANHWRLGHCWDHSHQIHLWDIG